MGKLRIIFVMEDLCYGGTQRQTLQLAQRLDRTRYCPVLVTLTGKTDLDDEALASGIEVHHMGHGREVDTVFFLRLLHTLKDLDPDVVVPCTAMPNIWGRIWGWWLKKIQGRPQGVLGTVRGGGAPVRQHEKWLWRLCDHMVCNSPELVTDLRGLGVPEDRITCIANGVDTERFAPVEPSPSKRAPLIVCVARLCEDKDHETLIKAFEQVYAANNRARLRLVGDGPWHERIQNRIAGSNAQYGMELLPGCADVRPHLAEAQIFALSSVREGQPNVLLEAMASGLPVCATSVGGIPDMIAQGQNGLLCAAGDADALAQNLLKLLNDPALLDSMGASNRQKALADYSFATMVSAHEAIFDRLCGLGDRG